MPWTTEISEGFWWVENNIDRLSVTENAFNHESEWNFVDKIEMMKVMPKKQLKLKTYDEIWFGI